MTSVVVTIKKSRVHALSSWTFIDRANANALFEKQRVHTELFTNPEGTWPILPYVLYISANYFETKSKCIKNSESLMLSNYNLLIRIKFFYFAASCKFFFNWIWNKLDCRTRLWLGMGDCYLASMLCNLANKFIFKNSRI